MSDDGCSYKGCDEDGEFDAEFYDGETRQLCEVHAREAHGDELAPNIPNPPEPEDDEDDE